MCPRKASGAGFSLWDLNLLSRNTRKRKGLSENM